MVLTFVLFAYVATENLSFLRNCEGYSCPCKECGALHMQHRLKAVLRFSATWSVICVVFPIRLLKLAYPFLKRKRWLLSVYYGRVPSSVGPYRDIKTGSTVCSSFVCFKVSQMRHYQLLVLAPLRLFLLVIILVILRRVLCNLWIR